ncbi:MAG: Mur ligase family protein [Patescibacteria group bacterium]
MKRLIRKFIPKFLLQTYHWCLASMGAWWYRYPSRRLIVIGVTGTKGKSTTVTLISRILEQAGNTVGVVATTHFKIGSREWVNQTKQTMPGRFRLQQLLREMVWCGCRYVVVETSSEGIAQFRHVGIDYDLAVFTNLSPEHIESHGSFERYRDAKLRLFQRLSTLPTKVIAGERIPKMIVVNADDPEADRFLSADADRRFTYSLRPDQPVPQQSDMHVIAERVAAYAHHTEFVLNHQLFRVWLLGTFNVYNILAAACVGAACGISWNQIREAVEQNVQIPGRLEEISNLRRIRIFVDYAHEPASLESVYRAMKPLHAKHLIVVLGSQGGGRDRAKRPVMGTLAGTYADYVIVTNEDPYDEDPQHIIDDVMAGVITAGKIRDQNCWAIPDRRAALSAALKLAQAGDVVLVTGKGSETVMAVSGGRLIPWDDRQAIRDILH